MDAEQDGGKVKKPRKAGSARPSKRTARGSGRRGKHTASRTAERVRSTASATATPGGAPDGPPPPGLDDGKHATAQRAAHQAEIMRRALFPSMMANALRFDGTFDSGAYKIYLERLLDDAGNPTDPIEIMMYEQMALAHYRIGQLHVGAGYAKSLEGVKVYNSATARLWGEFRRTALALRAYRTHIPEGKSVTKLKIYKMAQ